MADRRRLQPDVTEHPSLEVTPEMFLRKHRRGKRHTLNHTALQPREGVLLDGGPIFGKRLRQLDTATYWKIW